MLPNSKDGQTLNFIFHGTANGHNPTAPLPETLLDSMFHGMEANKNVVIFNGVGKKKRPGTLRRTFEDHGLPAEVAAAELKLEEHAFILGKARGLLLGTGMKETAMLAIQEIFRFKQLHGKFPSTINILGRSRGGITGILFAHQIREIFGENIQINIMAVDPVAGTSNRGTAEIRSLPAHVTYKAILAGDEAKPGFEVQGPDRMIVPTTSTAEFVHLPGTHDTASKQREGQHTGVANLAHDIVYKFMSEHGSEFAETPQIVWRSKIKPIRYEQRKYQPYSDKESLETYSDLACNTSKYKSWWGLARTRSHIDHLSSFNGHLQFFVNDQHRQLFRGQFPELYDYIFARNTLAQMPEAIMAKLESLRNTEPAVISWLNHKGLISAADDKPIQLNQSAIDKIRPFWGDALDALTADDKPQDAIALEHKLQETLTIKIRIATSALAVFARTNAATSATNHTHLELIKLVRQYSLDILALKNKGIVVTSPAEDPAIRSSQQLLAIAERAKEVDAKIADLVGELQKSRQVPYALYFALGDALTYSSLSAEEHFKEKVFAVRTAYFNALSRDDGSVAAAKLLWVNCMRIVAAPNKNLNEKTNLLHENLNSAIKRLDPNNTKDRLLLDDLLHARTLKDTVMARVLKDIKSYQKWNVCKSYLALFLKVITLTFASRYNRTLAQQKYTIAHELGSNLKELQKRAATLSPEQYQQERDLLIFVALDKARQARLENGVQTTGDFEKKMSQNLSDTAAMVYKAHQPDQAGVHYVEAYQRFFHRADVLTAQSENTEQALDQPIDNKRPPSSSTAA